MAERAPRKGSRLAAEKKRKAKEGAKGSKRNKNRNKKSGPRDEAGMMAEAEASGGQGLAGEVEEAATDTDSGEEEPGSELRLMYNSVRGYVSAIMELWKHQVAKKLHSSPPPHNMTVKALETSVARGEHQRRRDELEDRGLASPRRFGETPSVPERPSNRSGQTWTFYWGTPCFSGRGIGLPLNFRICSLWTYRGKGGHREGRVEPGCRCISSVLVVFAYGGRNRSI